MTLHTVKISPSTMPKPAEILRQQFFKSLGWPWNGILPESRLEEILTEEEISYRNRLYTPIVTLWAMLYQVLSPDKSLSNTLKCITTWLTAAGVKPPSSDTGVYSTLGSKPSFIDATTVDTIGLPIEPFSFPTTTVAV